MSKRHPDVEFWVAAGDNFLPTKFKSFADASYAALSVAANTGSPVNLDVLVYSEAGAQWVGGADAVEVFRDDPTADLFQRYKISVQTTTDGVFKRRR